MGGLARTDPPWHRPRGLSGATYPRDERAANRRRVPQGRGAGSRFAREAAAHVGLNPLCSMEGRQGCVLPARGNWSGLDPLRRMGTSPPHRLGEVADDAARRGIGRWGSCPRCQERLIPIRPARDLGAVQWRRTVGTPRSRRRPGPGSRPQRRARPPHPGSPARGQGGTSEGRGNVGRQIYAEVNRIIDAEGISKQDAFARVAEAQGRQTGTVAANYYRVARREGGGRVASRAASRRRPAWPAPGGCGCGRGDLRAQGRARGARAGPPRSGAGDRPVAGGERAVWRAARPDRPHQRWHATRASDDVATSTAALGRPPALAVSRESATRRIASRSRVPSVPPRASRCRS